LQRTPRRDNTNGPIEEKSLHLRLGRVVRGNTKGALLTALLMTFWNLGMKV
jgi:hypothetical protein